MAMHLSGVNADSDCMTTFTLSFIVAVNALFLSFSPLKIREHAGLSCARHSIPHMVGKGGCGSDGSTAAHPGEWTCVPGYQSLRLTSQRVHAALPLAVSTFWVSLKDFTGTDFTKAKLFLKEVGMKDLKSEAAKNERPSVAEKQAQINDLSMSYTVLGLRLDGLKDPSLKTINVLPFLPCRTRKPYRLASNCERSRGREGRGRRGGEQETRRRGEGGEEERVLSKSF
ncbi:LOW QUALITY PROTEIN: uncharacterized protein LINC03103 [Macaca fascicularis]|uniref:LOW QUALITY PROTEIN: uncharacterized protein LINC03103 n=1 Tax=Macaca fascicularis TaxID=9541 RepID=UPI0032B03E26